jgi:hypothetical protein
MRNLKSSRGVQWEKKYLYTKYISHINISPSGSRQVDRSVPLWVVADPYTGQKISRSGLPDVRQSYTVSQTREYANISTSPRSTSITPQCKINKQEVLGRTNRLLSLIRHWPHWKRRFQQFFYYCVCIRYHGNVSTEPRHSNGRKIFTEPLPINDRGIHRHTHTHTQTATGSHKPTLFLA